MASPTTRDWGSSDMPSLADLIRMGKQYIGDAMPGGSLNPETAPVARQANYLSGILDPASQVSQDATNWHKRTQIGLKDQLAGRQTPEAEQAYQTMMMAAGMAPIGMTAWHGSPHKFSKFSLDKIGTGEGAQAYGHGLYLAESPEVAKSYRFAGIGTTSPEWVDKTGVRLTGAKKDMMDMFGPIDGKPIADLKLFEDELASYAGRKQAKEVSEFIRTNEPYKTHNFDNLYKTDIPDEAVAKMLDWDKPLSQQAPEVQAALAPFIREYGLPMEESGSSLYSAFNTSAPKASDALRNAGIPGIRYLDGGSRSAGQGSSNFVAFDPEMIRILERNGQATGLEPWKPGEYRLKDLIGKE